MADFGVDTPPALLDGVGSHLEHFGYFLIGLVQQGALQEPLLRRSNFRASL
jgi:hypothetical protein